MGIEYHILEYAKNTGYEEGYDEGLMDGIEKGKIEGKKLIIFQIFKKFPDWSDDQVAELVNEPIEFIEKVRQRCKMRNRNKKANNKIRNHKTTKSSPYNFE